MLVAEDVAPSGTSLSESDVGSCPGEGSDTGESLGADDKVGAAVLVGVLLGAEDTVGEKVLVGMLLGAEDELGAAVLVGGGDSTG